MLEYAGKLRDYVRANGYLLLSVETGRRVTSIVRGAYIGRKLRTVDLRIGASAVIRGLSSMAIGPGFRAGAGLWLEAITRYGEQSFSPRIVIGKGVCVSQHVHIAAIQWVEIGDHCLIGSKVLITDHSHGQYSEVYVLPEVPPAQRPICFGGRVVIGQNVWLGDGVAIMPGVEIGEGSVIGANSVVTKNVPRFAVAAGNPARVIKTYNCEAKRWT